MCIGTPKAETAHPHDCTATPTQNFRLGDDSHAQVIERHVLVRSFQVQTGKQVKNEMRVGNLLVLTV